MNTYLILPLLACAGCYNFDFDLSKGNKPCGQLGETGQYYLGFYSGALFQSCLGLSSAMAPDGATAWVNSTPVSTTSKPFVGVRSTDENVMTAAYSVSEGLSIKSSHPGRAFLELYDDSSVTIDRGEVIVQSPNAVAVTGLEASQPPVPLLSGSSLFVAYRAGTAGPLLGVGAGILETTGTLTVVKQPDAYNKWFSINDTDPRMTVGVAGTVGAGSLTIRLGDASAMVPVELVDPSTLTALVALPSSVTLSAVGGAEAVTIVAHRDAGVVRGANCQWTVPAALDPPLQASSELLGSPPGVRYSFISRTPGHYTATCVSGSQTVNVAITVKP